MRVSNADCGRKRQIAACSRNRHTCSDIRPRLVIHQRQAKAHTKIKILVPGLFILLDIGTGCCADLRSFVDTGEEITQHIQTMLHLRRVDHPLTARQLRSYRRVCRHAQLVERMLAVQLHLRALKRRIVIDNCLALRAGDVDSRIDWRIFFNRYGSSAGKGVYIHCINRECTAGLEQRIVFILSC